MRTYHTTFVSMLSAAALSAAGGQVATRAPRAITVEPSMPRAAIGMRLDNPRAVIGVTTSTSTGPRDTLGLLVSSVTRNSPAEKAGIEEGNRIASINGVNLKLAASDLDDPDMASLMSRRLVRELDKMKPGDDADLKVYGGGQIRSIKVKTVDPDSLYALRPAMRRNFDDRATLGVSIGSSGSKRDTLGIFVMAVDEGGPAAKAGIEEGQRIAAINGVDLRVTRDDAGDDVVSSARINRLNREMAKVKAGDAVELKVYANGQTRTVKVTTVAASDMPGFNRSMTIVRPGGVMIRKNPPDGAGIDIDGTMIGESVRRAIENAQMATGNRLEDLGRVLDSFGRGLRGPGEVRWFNDDEPLAGPVARAKPAPATFRKTSTTISM